MCFVPIKDLYRILIKGFEDGLPWLSRFGCNNDVDEKPLLIKCTEDSQCIKPIDKTKCSECSKCYEFHFKPPIDKAPNVKYLPYKPGHITSVKLPVGYLAISGPFSGCWMGFSIDGTGILTVYHVATGDNDKCKSEFLTIAGDSNHFLPAKILKNTYIEDKDKFEQRLTLCGYQTDLLNDVYGIITSDNKYYSVIMGIKNRTYCVAAWIEWEVEERCQISKSVMASEQAFYHYMPLEGERLSNQ